MLGERQHNKSFCTLYALLTIRINYASGELHEERDGGFKTRNVLSVNKSLHWASDVTCDSYSPSSCHHVLI